MAMDDDEGLSFGYQMPEDVTDALLRRFRRDRDALARGGQETRGGDNIGPFVYQAEGLTFAYVQHESKEGGKCKHDAHVFANTFNTGAWALCMVCSAQLLSMSTKLVIYNISRFPYLLVSCRPFI